MMERWRETFDEILVPQRARSFTGDRKAALRDREAARDHRRRGQHQFGDDGALVGERRFEENSCCGVGRVHFGQDL